MTALEEIKKALAAAEQFIVNGVELGYIRMPDPQTPDSAHDTLPMIRQAQISLESLQRENEELRQRLDIGPCGEDAIDVAESAADHLRHRAEAAEAALKPFVAFFDEAMAGFTEGYSDRHPDKIICGVNGAELSISAFIAASTALASTGGEHHAD